MSATTAEAAAAPMQLENKSDCCDFASSSVIRLQLPSHKSAIIMKQCLEVDEELQPDKIRKEFHVDDNIFEIRFFASDIRVLRVAMSSIFDMATVSLKTLMEFDSEAP